jgi:hypothetical protein
MQTISESAMVQLLEGMPEGTTAFVSYVAGCKPTERAIEEARPHTEGPPRQPRRYFFGRIHSLFQNRYGEWCLTLFAENRDTIKDGIRFKGGYRTFNPRLGKLVVLALVRPAGRVA